MRYQKNKGGYKFTDKVHSINGIISTGIGAIVVITMLVLIIRSCVLGGKAPIYYGGIGIVATILSLVGLIVGVNGIREEEVFRYFPMIGIVLNGILFLFLFILYIIGFAS